MRRRSLLTLMAVSPALLAPGIGRRVLAPGGEPAQQAAATQYALRLPQLAFDGAAPHVALSNGEAFQGGTVMVSIDRARSGTARIFERSHVLAPEGAGVAGFVPVGIFDPPGATTVSIDLIDGYGMPIRADLVLRIQPTDWTVDYIWLPPPPPPDPNAPPPPPPPPDETELLPQVYAGVTPRQWRATWGAPLPEPLWVTGYFGEQRSFNGGPVQGHHGGTDFGAEEGTPIYATNDGTVVLSGHYRWRGELVVVDHGAGVFSLYGHMSARAVEAGTPVTQGQVLGYVGSTGLSSGPHLHWEMAVGGVLVDGLRWLDGSQGF